MPVSVDRPSTDDAIVANGEHIVHPGYRPPDPARLGSGRFAIGVAQLVLGFLVITIGAFLEFGEWLFVVGSIAMIASSFVLRGFVRSGDHDRRKLYRYHQV